MPDGAVAHISLGGVHVEARWLQVEGTWSVVGSSPAEASSGHPPLSLLYTGTPTVRLPQQLSPSAPAPHRITLLVQLGTSASNMRPTFVGSTGHEAAPEASSGEEQVVQVVARGCWGTCLPVAVSAVDWESEAGSTCASAPAAVPCPSLVAITVSADALCRLGQATCVCKPCAS